ncbi:MAG: hypothetical protein ACR2NP_01220 [Pirellulaceae bacterium]
MNQVKYPALTIMGIAIALCAGQISAQTVLLPSFSNFTYRGAVSVPDGGTMSLGGIKRSSESSVSRGVPGLSGIPGLGRGFGNRGIGRETGSSGLNVKPQILIMEELEQQALAQANGIAPPAGFQAVNEAVLRKAAFLTEHMGRRAVEPDPGQQSPEWRTRR